MFRQIKLLTALQIKNIFGINEALHSRDAKRRRQLLGMAVLFAFVGLVICFYVALLSYGLIYIQMGQLVPALLAVVVSVVILCFTTLRAGPVIYDLASYDRLIAMPIRPTAIVVSRFLTMYGADAGLALLVLLPGTVVYGLMLHPSAAFYPLMLLGALVLPLIPMALALLLGGLIYFISARLRWRNLAVMVLSMLALMAIMVGSILLSGTKSMDVNQMANITAGVSETLCGIFPPAAWFAAGVTEGAYLQYLALVLVSLAVFALVAWVLGQKFQKICALLTARAGRGNYALKTQEENKRSTALFRREIRRYFASPVYVLNTLSGGIMGVLLCVGLLVAGERIAAESFNLPWASFANYAPLLLAFMLVISPSTSCAISMEGKQFWMICSLPVRSSEIYWAKIKVQLCVGLPCWVVCEAMLMIALNPSGVQLVWMILAPLGYLFFGAVLGLWMNLKMPMLHWESERQPVKQSRAVSFMVLAGFVSILLVGAVMYFIPDGLMLPLQLLVICGLWAATWLFWRSCLRIPLNEIDG